MRTQRNRFAVLKTDHKAISAEIEKYLHIALAPPDGARHNSATEPVPVQTTSSATAPAPARSAEATSDNSVPQPSPSPALSAATNGASVSPPPAPIRPAFALVDLVSENSPAAAAGLLVNDRIVSFGAVSLRSFATPQLAMAALPGLLREHENQSVDVIVQRAEGGSRQEMTLGLTPRQWSGPGLLGCHVLPLAVSQVDAIYQPEVITAVMNHAGQNRV